jgi:leucine dehydrogenase
MTVQNQNNISTEEVMAYAQELGFGDVHYKFDAASGLKAIVAIHSTKLGPSLGGCRCLPYPSTAAATKDALRLARGMSFKAAMVGLPYGGGKSVIMRPEVIENREGLFEAFGRFVDELGGRYITAIDSGTSLQDMDIVGRSTPYVAGNSQQDDPSIYTALGVLHAIQAAVRFKLNRDNLKGLHVMVQGAGNVGYRLAKELSQQGAKVSVSDVNQANIERCVQDFGADVVSPDDVYSIDCDIFAPCALGGIINDITIPQLKAQMVVGAANNQLGDDSHGIKLHQRGILYAPDYVANAGGLIHVIYQYENKDFAEGLVKVKQIYERIYDILTHAKQQDQPTNLACDEMALDKLK